MPKATFFNLAAEKRETILDLALDEFADNDYEAASISRIVARAGIAKGSFYQYFENKQDLYQYLFELVAKEKVAYFNERMPLETQSHIFSYLSAILTHRVSFDLTYPRYAKLTYRAVAGETSLPNELIEDAKGVLDQYLMSVIEQGIAQGDIDPTIDVNTAVFLLSAVMIEFGRAIAVRLRGDASTMAAAGDLPLEADTLQHFFDKLLYILQHGMGTSPRIVD